MNPRMIPSETNNTDIINILSFSIDRMTESIRQTMNPLQKNGMSVTKSIMNPVDKQLSHSQQRLSYHIIKQYDMYVHTYVTQRNLSAVLKSMTFAERYASSGPLINTLGKNLFVPLTLYDRLPFPHLIEEFVNYKPQPMLPHSEYIDNATLDATEIYKNMILSELHSKSVSISFNFRADEPNITLRNTNVNVSITNPEVIDFFKNLLIKTLQ